MKIKSIFVTALMVITTQQALAASSLEIAFKTQNLKSQDAQAKVTLVSTNRLCNKVYLNPYTGVAITPTYKESPVTIDWQAADKGVLTVEYKEGGFCDYVLDSVTLTFRNGKTYFHSVNFYVSDGENFVTGFLGKYEILQNPRSATAHCYMEKGFTQSTCLSIVEGEPGNGRGFPATFYLNRDFLTGSDRIEDVNLVYSVKN